MKYNILEIENLSVKYDNFSLKNISYQMENNSITTVIGESGSGKTTLVKAISAYIAEGITGKIKIDGIDLLSLSERELSRLRSRLFSVVLQNSAESLNPTMTVYEHIEEILKKECKDRKKNRERIYELIATVGLKQNDLNLYPRELSGGMIQKLSIAVAIALEPKLVIMDEPTSSLDASSNDNIINLIKRLNKEKSISFLIVTHSLSLAYKLSDETIVIYGGNIMEIGSTSEIMKLPRHPYTRGLINSSLDFNIAKDIWGIPNIRENGNTGCPFFARCTQCIDKCRDTPLSLELDNKYNRLIACHRGGIVKLLESDNINKAFGKKAVLENIALDIYSGEIVSLVGKSGVGKTTLAKILGGFDSSDTKNNVLFDGKPVSYRELHSKYNGIQYIFQDSDSALNLGFTVLEAICEPMRLCKEKKTSEELLSTAKKALYDVGLSSEDYFLNSCVGQLSGGEKQRICIARALTMKPRLLIADEPTSQLDSSTTANLLRIFKGLQNQYGFSMLIITHNLASALKISDRIYIIKDKKLNYINPSDYIITNINEIKF